MVPDFIFEMLVIPFCVAIFVFLSKHAAESGVYDADYMRLRQLSIGYTVPSSVLDGTFIQSASVSLIGKNLFFISNDVDLAID